MSNNVTVIPKKPVRHSLLTSTENIVYMPLASKNSHGIVKVGNGLNITTDGLLFVDFSSEWYSGVEAAVEQLKIDINDVKTDVGELAIHIDDLEYILQNHDTRINANYDAIASKIDETYLQNYYTKTETYNKQEINKLIVPAQGLRKEIVNTLPETGIDNVLYMVPKIDASGNDYYDEYLYIVDRFELVGTTQTNLEGYVTTEEYNKLVNNETQIQNGNKLLLAGANPNSNGIAIGKNTNNDAWNGVSIGHNASNVKQAVAIGSSAETKLVNGVAIGAGAEAYEVASIQLGQGRNTIPRTLQIINDNIYNADTHTLTVQNIELNGENLADKLGGSGVSQEDFDKLVNNEVQINNNGTFKAGGANVNSVGSNFIAIGNGAKTERDGGAIAIGNKANVRGSSGIAIGNKAEVSGSSGIAIGGSGAYSTYADGSQSIQIGYGRNNKNNTLQVYADNIYNHSTHTLTVQNIELNGENLADKLENAGGTNIVSVEDSTITTNKLEKVVHLSEEQYQELVANGSITIGEQTLTYSDNAVYVTPDESSGGGAESGGSAKKYQHNINFNQSNIFYTLSFIDTNATAYTKVGEFKDILSNNGFVDQHHCLPCSCVTESGYGYGYGIMNSAFVSNGYLSFFGYKFTIVDGALSKETIQNSIVDTKTITDIVVEV